MLLKLTSSDQHLLDHCLENAHKGGGGGLPYEKVADVRRLS